MRRRLTAPVVASFLVLSTTAVFGEVSESPSKPYYDIGGFHYKVSTDSELAQTWFNRGLAMCIGFNHEEAVRCFERALGEDPSIGDGVMGNRLRLGP